MPVIFVLGVFNLMLGFALAVLLERRVVVPYPSWRRGGGGQFGEVDPAVVETIPVVDTMEKLPNRWIEILEASGVEFSTVVEATVEVLKLEVDDYREALLDFEDSIRDACDGENLAAIDTTLQSLVALNEEWVEQQHDALRTLAENRAQLGQYAVVGSQLEALLLDQTVLIKTECSSLQGARDGFSGSDSLYASIGRLVCMAHELRDTIRTATLTIIREEGRLESVTRKQQQDQMTGLPNRIGLEMIFRSWWREDQERQRLVSVALIDLDRFGELNCALSTRVGDRVLRAIAKYVEQLVARESGLEHVFRFNGNQFLVFFGDSGPRSAASKIEMVRQTIQETRLDYNGVQYALTMRAGVTDVRRDDDLASLLKRLETVTESTRHAGRNCTALNDPAGSGIVQAEKLDIRRRVNRVQ